MMTRNGLCLFVLCLLLGVGAGCVSSSTTIPIGQWTGQGTYVDYEACDIGNAAKTTSRSRSRAYPTMLSIEQEELFGHKALVFEISSQRGKLLNMEGKETHLKFILVPIETLENESRLYSIVYLELNPPPEHKFNEGEFRERLRVAGASSIQRAGTTILQVCYMMPSEKNSHAFIDTFVFKGRTLQKTGQFVQIETTKKKGERAEEKLLKVYWSEELHKIK